MMTPETSMLKTSCYAAAGVAVLILTAGVRAPATRSILPNDNTRPAGTRRDTVTTVALEVRTGGWQPDGPGGRVVDSLAAFGEVGKPLSTPGPLVRVLLGTSVRGTIHNTLKQPLMVFGLGERRNLRDSIVVAPGATMPFHFAASEAGTFVYTAHTVLDAGGDRLPREMQLHGAIIIDRPGATPDRVMGISWYFVADDKSPVGLREGVMAINGLSWPHTERLQYAEGDSVHWRVVNFTPGDHPMHLHGFYFRVDSHSNGRVDSLYTPAEQRMAVTEVVPGFNAVSLAWKAERPGRWVFHCHYAVHLSNLVTLDTHSGSLDGAAAQQHPSDRPHEMFGLVMGIDIAARTQASAPSAVARKIRLVQHERPNVYGKLAGMSFTMDNEVLNAASPLKVPGPTLILERGKRVQVTVVNQMHEHASVHWHGIELESYPDGIAGWSGTDGHVLPAIMPGDSLSVSWTPPRAGSYMYHSHMEEAKQMGAGSYGPIIVLEPGQKYDPESDRTFFFGTAGMITNFAGRYPDVLMNGSAHPPPMDLVKGRHYRFRFFNLAGDAPTLVTLESGGKPTMWRAVAKDGYPLPASQATSRKASLRFDPGEIYDFEFIPEQTGELTLTFGLPPSPPPPPPKKGEPAPPSLVPDRVAVAVHVR